MTKRGMATASSPLNTDGGRSCSSCSNGRSRHASSIASRRAVGIRLPAETSSRSEHVALDAAIPTISVSGAVASARIASATSPSSRERGTYPSTLRRKKTWASRNSRSTEGEDREAKRRFVARMGDRELAADGDANQREHYQYQRPRSPPPNAAGVRGVLRR